MAARRTFTHAVATLLAAGLLLTTAGQAEPQVPATPTKPKASPIAAEQPGNDKQPGSPGATKPPKGLGPVAPDGLPKETVHIDVAGRKVAVTSSFTGTEVVVFGSVNFSRQPAAESGLYDVIVLIVGTPTTLMVRRKDRVAGIWLNNRSVRYQDVPSYYAIASTRPLEEVASKDVLSKAGIGFEHIAMRPAEGQGVLSPNDQKVFRDAIVRIKTADGLYKDEEYSVAFVGRSLFRASIDLPANITVGPLETRVFLFKDGEFLGQHVAKLTLERAGLERMLHTFAFGYPFLYGIAAVLLAVASGLAASALFRKGGAH
ncbi:MAG: TIGR02186 family protein [Hyphomicrobiaceae bacterium]|nr:TIGR02186 family protein [Hyphomicrobiaceae bacterium]